MIDVKYDGRYCNRLFQYFMAVVIAEKHKQEISNPFPTAIDDLKYNYKEDPPRSEKIEINDKNYNTFLTCKKVHANIHLVGYFQKKEVIAEFIKRKDRLFSNIGCKKPIRGTYVHLRLGDLLAHPERYCPLSYYEKALKKVDLDGELYLSSDSPEHPIVQSLISKYNFKILNLNEEKTILTASRFDNKILSLGTFSWWIGFLGNQKNVVCPNLRDYSGWHGKIFPCLDWKISSC